MVPALLERAGHKVDAAPDTETGLQQLDRQSYDLAILMESPSAESWVLCEKIRRFTAIPLIIISYNATTETCVKAVSAGADFFLRKAFGPLEFLARVNSLFQRTPYRQSVPLTP